MRLSGRIGGQRGEGGGHTHLVEQRDGRLQDLLPLAELRLVELPLQVQHLSPLTRRLRQGAGGGHTDALTHRNQQNLVLLRGGGLPVRHRVGVPPLQRVSGPLQGVQLIEEQHVESDQHQQTAGGGTRSVSTDAQEQLVPPPDTFEQTATCRSKLGGRRPRHKSLKLSGSPAHRQSHRTTRSLRF